MAITSIGLQQLGFDGQKDFALFDDSDGKGVYIKEWNSDKAQPSKSEIEAAEVEWKAAYDAKAYSRSKANEYPSIADQLDDIYHNGIDAWKATIKTTKDKYPKP